MVGSERSPQGGLSIIQMQALTSHIEKLLDRKLEEIHKYKLLQTTQGEMNNPMKEEKDNEEEQSRRRRPNQNNQRRHGNRREDDLGGIKIKVPSFQGKSEPKTYLEWEMGVDQIFSCQSYLEGKKVKLAALEFTDYTLKERARYRERLVKNWEEMKAIMMRRFVSSYFHRELHNKLQLLSQGSKSVDNYHKEMKMVMIRANILEDQEATVA
ncbi:hypothetical protein CR513_07011, partial [Mucuna pruriens]